MIEHWRLADTSARALAGAGFPSFALRVSRWKPAGPRPVGARSERSGDDSAVPALLGRETPPQPHWTCSRSFAAHLRRPEVLLAPAMPVDGRCEPKPQSQATHCGHEGAQVRGMVSRDFVLIPWPTG